jgi:hypothetical protein
VTLSTRALKVMSGAGAVVVCAVSGVLVAIDPKPASAPLRPPVGGQGTVRSQLSIPRSCAAIGDAGVALAPSLLPAAEQLRAATTATARRAILAPLTASQRLEVEAYVRTLRRGSAVANNQCDANSTPGGALTPSVINAPQSTQPLINTYVS